MNRAFIIISLTILSIHFNSCKDASIQQRYMKHNNVYLSYFGERSGLNIWIVDGDNIRQNYFDEFVYGGNSQRYTFIPSSEIWIDNSISASEFETTVAHEIKERELMSEKGLLYSDAHDSALALEVRMRNGWKQVCRDHERGLDSVTPRDFDSTMEIVTLSEKIKLQNIYRVPLGRFDNVDVWVVDGYAVRRDIFPDFGFSGNDKEYLFIPNGEIWIDGEVSCEETNYSIALELKERDLLIKGVNYNDAYTSALSHTNILRDKNRDNVLNKPEVPNTEPAFRDTGTGIGLR
ncbi:MAG: hypothetical protein ABI792_04715 [bacterium]